MNRIFLVFLLILGVCMSSQFNEVSLETDSLPGHHSLPGSHADGGGLPGHHTPSSDDIYIS